jgi:type IV pilus assembly protein PilN
MPRINLLPWREEQRTLRRNQFFMALGVTVGVAAIILVLGYVTFNTVVDNQRTRNDFLKAEIASLDKRIEAIIDLEEKKDNLLERMEIIEQLQRSRPGIVHVFEELVHTLPDGVYLTSVKQNGDRLEIAGSAESNTRVSALMRNIDQSEWLTAPDLEVVEVRADQDAAGNRASRFTVFAQQVAQPAEDEEGE